MSVGLAYGKLNKGATCRSDLPVLPAKPASPAMQCLPVMVVAIKTVVDPVDRRHPTRNAVDHRTGYSAVMRSVGQIILQPRKAQHERWRVTIESQILKTGAPCQNARMQATPCDFDRTNILIFRENAEVRNHPARKQFSRAKGKNACCNPTVATI